MLDIDMENADVAHEPVDVDLSEREAAREAARKERREPLFRTSESDLNDKAIRVITIDGGEPLLTEDRTVRDLQKESWDTAENHGFHDAQHTFGDKIALLHSELSEALEDFRAGHAPDEVWYADSQDTIAKPCGIPTELADVFIRLVDMAECYGIDLQSAVEEKMEFNKTRPFLHGKTL